MKPWSLAGIALMTLVSSLEVQAGGIDRLRTFVSETRSGEARFEQVLEDRSGKKVQRASGSFQFERPGRFRWAYEKPYEQLIVGDGSRFWVYDKDLNQVTVKKLDQALGSSPAALLAGSDDIEAAFTLVDGGEKDGLEWVRAVPRNREAGFDSISMGFDQRSLPAAMVLKDHFGQTTLLRFASVERNPRLAQDLFRFTPPKGADVVGE